MHWERERRRLSLKAGHGAFGREAPRRPAGPSRRSSAQPQDGVSGVDHHHSRHVHHRHEPVLSEDHRAGAVDDDHLVGVPFPLPEARRGVPRADVVPSGVEGDHLHPGGLLHHGVVHGAPFRRHPRAATPREVGADRPDDPRRGSLGLLEEARGAPDEHPAVPEVPSRADEASGGRPVGFLHEALDFDGLDARRASGALEIAESGGGPVGPDAQADQRPALGGAHRDANAPEKRARVPDDVVGREDPDHGARILGADGRAGEGDRGCGVPRGRLDDQPVALQVRQHAAHVPRQVRGRGDPDPFLRHEP
jgi:hypothetical protein